MRSVIRLLCGLLLLTSFQGASGQPGEADWDRALTVAKRTADKVYRDQVNANWMPGGNEFWYKVRSNSNTWEYVRVNPETGTIRRAPDLLSLGLKAAEPVAMDSTPRRRTRFTGDEIALQFTNTTQETVELFWIDTEGNRRSYGQLRSGETREQHTFIGHVWAAASLEGKHLGSIEASAATTTVQIGANHNQGEVSPHSIRSTSPSQTTPRWCIFFRDHQAWLKDPQRVEETQLTTNGTAQFPYKGPVVWSSDFRACILHRMEVVDTRKVTIVEAAPREQEQPRVHVFDYAKPGDPLPKPHLYVVKPEAGLIQEIPNDVFATPYTPEGEFRLRWVPGVEEFFFEYNQRGHQIYRLIAINPDSGGVRTVIEEKADTFVDYSNKIWRHWLVETGEVLWMSERFGWAHLWLYDLKSGRVKARVTQGDWVVRSVEYVDQQARQVWFMASGLRDEEDPYYLHLCRVNFDGSGLQRLTEGPGTHQVKFSSDRRYFLDTWSRVDQPPVTELRRSNDGHLIAELERADISDLLATGWRMPERFAAKGRDGKTDIFGIIIRPDRMDPENKYPVLEEIYAGPHGAFVPKSFGRLVRQQAFAELGFTVVQIDGMGTNHRGKKFQDVAWKNLQDSGFPDRVKWLKAAALDRSWMDLSRVGIYGGSAGGQSAMRAVLDYSDFYRAAFADCGCHDNRMDKMWWNEQWLGWPIDESYVKASNVEDAGKLNGALMLCVGEVDRNVDPASTMQVVAALQKAKKEFDMLVMAGVGHGAAETEYASRRRMEFFVRELQSGVQKKGASLSLRPQENSQD